MGAETEMVTDQKEDVKRPELIKKSRLYHEKIPYHCSFHHYSIKDFKDVKSVMVDGHMVLISNAFVSSCYYGIIRNIEYMLPYLITDHIDVIQKGLWSAVRHRHTDIVDWILTHNEISTNYLNGIYLFEAVKNNDSGMVKKLLAAGADPNSDLDIVVMCCEGNPDDKSKKIDRSRILTLLLESGISIPYGLRQELVLTSFSFNNHNCAKLLLNHECRIDTNSLL
jgi:hypothetical protein